MPRYREEIIVIDINDRPMFGENVEDAMRQGYVPLGNPTVKGDSYILFMIKQQLVDTIEAGGDVRSYMSELDQARKIMRESEKEKANDGTETAMEVPFG